MGNFIIQGGPAIEGKLRVQGSKNSSLPILAATVLNGQKNTINDIPDITDINMMCKILEFIGARICRNGQVMEVNLQSAATTEIPENLMREMRSSIVIMGALLGRFGKAKVSYPGGCEIGPRPIDLHLKGLSKMGVSLTEKHGFIYAQAGDLRGAEIHLDYPSVGATENLMMAAVLAKGRTIIRNVAKEPEIVDLQNFLNKMGAQVKGAGADTIKIEGCDISDLKGVRDHTVIPDRIVAGTYLAAAAITRGHVVLTNVISEHMEPILAKLREIGCNISLYEGNIEIAAPKTLKSVDNLRTLPHPGFPTDMQAPMMALLSTVEGTSIVTETVFENRFKHTEELRRMGANININGSTAIIKGVKKLTGAKVEAKDLRAGAALILAGLAAEGETLVEGSCYVERGYESIESSLSALCAHIEKVD